MKILKLISNPFLGGTETFIVALTPFLERAGVEVDILNIWKDSHLKPIALSSDLNYIELDSTSRRISFANARKIVKLIRDRKYDIVMGYGIRVSMFLRVIKPWIRNIPIIIGLRGLDNWRKWHHVWADRFTEFAIDMFIPNSQAVAKRRMLREKTPSSKMVVIPNGIDTNHFDRAKFSNCDRRSLRLPEDKLILTTIANFRYQKGHNFLLHVIGALAEKFDYVHFVWVGAGPLRDQLEQEAEALGVAEKITILNYVDDVRLVLACTDIYLMPSMEEGMPRCLMEAMAMTLPCIATNVGGTPEVIKNGVNGLLADYGDIENFGNNTKKLIVSAELRMRIATAARKCIVDYFRIEAIAAQYLKLFELVCSGQRDGREIQKILSFYKCTFVRKENFIAGCWF